MTTSGTVTYTQTLQQLINDAYQVIGVYATADTVSTGDYNLAVNLLNKMIKAWEGQGIHLWTQTEGAIFLTLNQQSYSLAATSTDIQGIDPVFQTLTATATGSTLVVNTTKGMNVNDHIGIKLDNNTLQWTTITNLNADGITITINTGLTSQASSGNNVFVYTNPVDLPLWITSARYMSAAGVERPLVIKGRDDFMSLPNKTYQGKANTCSYSPKTSAGTFYVWPVADDVGDCIRITYMRRIQDLVNTTDNFDLPQEWLETITWNLAVRLGSIPAFADQSKLTPEFIKLAEGSLANMQAWDIEEGSSRIVSNYRYDDP